MVSTKWCLMQRSGSVSPRCGCPLSLALLLLAEWTKPSRGQHIRTTSSRPEGEPTEIEGFMIGPPWGSWSSRDVRHFHFLSLFPFLSHDLSFRLSRQVVFQGLTKGDVSVPLSLLPASTLEVQGQRAVGRKVDGGLLRRAAPSPTIWIHHSLEEEDKQQGITGNMNR